MSVQRDCVFVSDDHVMLAQLCSARRKTWLVEVGTRQRGKGSMNLGALCKKRGKFWNGTESIIEEGDLDFPNICMNGYWDHKMNIRYINDIEDIFDKSVIEANGVLMYGCAKPGREPYVLTKVYNQECKKVLPIENK